jgi:hypothetical protein
MERMGFSKSLSMSTTDPFPQTPPAKRVALRKVPRIHRTADQFERITK